MATKKIKCTSGTVEITDEYGLRIRIEDADGQTHSMNLYPEDMRKIARALDAFAEIYSN